MEPMGLTGLGIVLIFLAWVFFSFSKNNKIYNDSYDNAPVEKKSKRSLNPVLGYIKSKLHLKKKKGAYQTIYGKVSEIQIEIKIDIGKSQSCLTIKTDHDYGSRLTIEKEGVASKLGKQIGFNDYHIGDSDFDNLMLLRAAHPEELMLFFNKHTRSIVSDIAQHAFDFTISKDHFKVSILFKDVLQSKDHSVALINKMIEVSSRFGVFTRKKDLEAVLLQNIKAEKVPEVKIKMLKVLGKYYDVEKMNVQRQLSAIMHNDEDLLTRIIAARYINSAGETFLISQVNIIKPECLYEIVMGLRKIGTIKCLQYLKELQQIIQESNNELLHAIVKTIDIIQSREDVTHLGGGISVHKPHESEGGLSSARSTEEGMVSLPDFERDKNNERKL